MTIKKISSFINRIINRQKDFGLSTTIKLELYSRFSKKKYDALILRHFKENYLYLLEELIVCKERQEKAQKIIWVYWAQGFNNMPEIVLKCYESIQRHKSDYNVIFLSDDNFHKYIDLPNYIIEKYKKGIIGIAHFSDILRVGLLKNYGGIWLDIKFFLSEDIPSYIYDYKFFSFKMNVDEVMVFIPKGKWVLGFISTNQTNNVLFQFLYNFFMIYWLKNNCAIDYLMFDYIIEIAYNYNKEIREMIDNVPINNENSRKLLKIINNEYNEHQWKEISSKAYIHR